MRRAQTFDASRNVYRHDDERRSQHGSRRHRHDGDVRDRADGRGHDAYPLSHGRRRHSHDVVSETGSHRSRRASRHPRQPGALTERNLEALTQASRTPPPPPGARRRDEAPPDEALSRLDLARGADASLPPRRRSEPELTGARDLDMNLAYGNVPPDLAERVDLDQPDDGRAQRLVRRVEGMLDEAHCLQHSALAMIRSLQEKPETAAQVALTLADLSSALARLSPSLLGALRGGSPAVFALLASPQFLVGTGIAVGVTVVMFGGWRIVKKVAEARAPREVGALDALASIETWRRGIPTAWAGAESADLELITPEADRTTRREYAADDGSERDRRSRHGSRTRRKTTAPGDRKVSGGGGGARSRRLSARDKAATGGDGALVKARARHGDNMLKAIFRGGKDKKARGGGSKKALVLA